ncbi:hypothetical protein HZS_3370 [Henneguya salminicola]|nr:hypothetical protein HZS_3370 [Henneguya salminicola]
MFKEIEESLLFKFKYNAVRALEVKKNETLISLIYQNIEKRATMIYDLLRAYFLIRSERYNHLTINPSL